MIEYEITLTGLTEEDMDPLVAESLKTYRISGSRQQHCQRTMEITELLKPDMEIYISNMISLENSPGVIMNQPGETGSQHKECYNEL